MATTSRDLTVTLRSATAGDLGPIEKLLIANNLPTDGVRDALRGFLVAVAEREIVGVVGLEYCGSYALLRSTAVAEEWRSRGVGRQLVERMIGEAESRGLNALYLLTTTAESYFPSFGFHNVTRDSVPDPIRTTGEFQHACPASAVVMCRPLGQSR
jgi:amino-acid N-acetyltransferase